MDRQEQKGGKGSWACKSSSVDGPVWAGILQDNATVVNTHRLFFLVVPHNNIKQ